MSAGLLAGVLVRVVGGPAADGAPTIDATVAAAAVARALRHAGAAVRVIGTPREAWARGVAEAAAAAGPLEVAELDTLERDARAGARGPLVVVGGGEAVVRAVAAWRRGGHGVVFAWRESGGAAARSLDEGAAGAPRAAVAFDRLAGENLARQDAAGAAWGQVADAHHGPWRSHGARLPPALVARALVEALAGAGRVVA